MKMPNTNVQSWTCLISLLAPPLSSDVRSADFLSGEKINISRAPNCYWRVQIKLTRVANLAVWAQPPLTSSKGKALRTRLEIRMAQKNVLFDDRHVRHVWHVRVYRVDCSDSQRTRTMNTNKQ